jgi:hypothetical protein
MPDYQPLRRYEQFNVRALPWPKIAQYTFYLIVHTKIKIRQIK